jgi:GntR family transcriptional regulator/MocR family aminotransferase
MDQLQARAALRPDAPLVGRRLYDLLRRQMADGTLGAGGKVPSTRALAAAFGVSRTTVTAVYEQLAAEGFIVTAAGRVARVASQLSPAAPPKPGRRAPPQTTLSAYGRRVENMALPALSSGKPLRVDFLYGAVAACDFPALPWRRAHQAALLQHQHRLYYEPPEGDASLRRALQGYLARARGLLCDAEQIVIVHGSQQAIDLCARVLLDPEDAFAFEDPGYLMARRCFEATGAKLLPVPVDDLGLDTTQLPEDRSVRLVYATPSHQFPLGAMLPIGRRQSLLRWAARRHAWIIEDDYDGEFRYGQRPIDALHSIDTQGRVIYIGTFSKALSPQLRLGYLVLPPELVPVFRQAKRLSDRHAPVLEQRALATLIDSGVYERHVRRVRRENERRRSALLDAIAQHLPAGARAVGTAAGLHVVLWLPMVRQQDEAAVVAAAREVGVGVYPVSPLYAGPPGRSKPRTAGLIVGYASLDVEQIRKGVRALAAVLHRLIHAGGQGPAV